MRLLQNAQSPGAMLQFDIKQPSRRLSTGAKFPTVIIDAKTGDKYVSKIVTDCFRADILETNGIVDASLLDVDLEDSIGEKSKFLGQENQSLREKSGASQPRQLFRDKSWEPQQRSDSRGKLSSLSETRLNPCLDRDNQILPNSGDRLPPTEFEDDENCGPPLEKDEVFSKGIAFPEVRTKADDSYNQQEIETSSFSHSWSSRNEWKLRTQPPASSKRCKEVNFSKLRRSSAEMSAACKLVELSNFSNFGEDCKLRQDSGNMATFHDSSHYLEEISMFVDNIYAALCPLRTRKWDFSSDLTENGSWTIEMSKDSCKLRIKRVKPDRGTDSSSSAILQDEDNEVFERPPRKRQYKSLRALS